MEESNCKDFLDNYRKVLFQCENENPDRFNSSSVQRRCLSQLYKASTKTLDNSGICTLLESKLISYAETVDNNGSNIYEDRLRAKLSNLKIQPHRNLKPITEASQLKLTPLSCSESQIICTASENYSESDYQQFIGIFRQKAPKAQKENEFTNRGTISEKRDHQRDPKVGNNEYLGGTSKPEDNLPRKMATSCFKTAHEELQQQSVKKYGNAAPSMQAGGQKRKLGMRRNINSKFIPPLLSNSGSEEMSPKSEEWPTETDDRLKNIDPKMVELIKSEIMDVGPTIEWNDIAGLEFAKTAIQEAVVWPMLRPDIFTGLRRPPKGILLFGPPGTGKTLIGKCVASQSRSTFFSISASSLTSKWIGDGEKMVRALFTVARCHQPAVIFIDEIDSLLSQRSDTEHESSRRIKTEFLVQLDGATTENEERLLVIGATNRPQELDEAARRRFVKRLYIPLPEFEARLQLIKRLITDEKNTLEDNHYMELAKLTNGYSGADIRSLCAEASMGPIRSLDFNSIEKIQVTEVRPLMIEDFEKALLRVKSSVSVKDLSQYITWNGTYGSGL